MVALSLLDCDEWRTETYLYDGDRRIAERWRDPIISNNGGGANGFQQQAATHTLWTEREYVYTPSYIDEFVGEIDANGLLWPILQDANQNAVAMLDDAGAIARQRILSPYGRVISSEKPTVVAPPKSRIGHQGLFADRLNAPTTADPLDAGSHNIWHNRNRTLLPELGRFAQRDPNATGQGASSMLDMHGSALHDGVSPPDPAALFGDGQNVYAYAVASPTQHRDPSGLVIGFLVPGPSDYITGALEGLVTEYTANLEWDILWASDWSLRDDAHTRTSDAWVNVALGLGIYDSFEFFGHNLLEPFATSFSMSRGGSGRWSPHLPSYRRFTSRWSAGDIGPYAHLANRYGDAAQYSLPRIKSIILEENRRMNGGALRSDLTGLPFSRVPGMPNYHSFDHIQPKSSGGTHDWGNFQLVELAWNVTLKNNRSNVYP